MPDRTERINKIIDETLWLELEKKSDDLIFYKVAAIFGWLWFIIMAIILILKG
jgi:hypothetical protein